MNFDAPKFLAVLIIVVCFVMRYLSKRLTLKPYRDLRFDDKQNPAVNCYSQLRDLFSVINYPVISDSQVRYCF